MSAPNPKYSLFVYHKDGKIQVLSLDEAHQRGEYLQNGGWEHTATIDPCTYIENLFNEKIIDKNLNLIK